MLRFKQVHKYHYTDNITILFANCQRKMFGAFLFYKILLFFSFTIIYLIPYFLLIYYNMQKERFPHASGEEKTLGERDFHTGCKRFKRLQKEIATAKSAKVSMWKPLFCRGRISVFKAISANCLLQLQIGQCGNHSFAIVGMLCRANIGRDYDSWFFRCRNLSLHKHRKTPALELGQQAQKQGRSETRISLPRVQKPPFAAAGDLCGRRCSNFPVQKPPFRNCFKNTIYWCCGSTNILVLARRESIQAETGKVIMANQEVTTHKQRKIIKQNNRRYTDI